MILLAACAGQEASLEGLGAGADNYLAHAVHVAAASGASAHAPDHGASARDELVMKLTHANEDLKAFSSSVSHDLGAPLHALDGLAGILEEDHASELTGEARRKIRMIRDSTRHMAEILETLLALSRIGYHAVQKERFVTATLIATICAESTAATGNSNVEISLGDLPPTRATRLCCVKSG